MGNALVMLVLAASAWLFAGLHEGDGWQASPSRDRVCIAVAAVVAYAGLVAGCLYRARTRDRAGHAVMHAGQDAVWVVHASQTGFAMELADMTAASLRQGGVAVQRAGLERLDAAQLQAIERAVFVVSTTGEGDPPDPALGFVRHVMSQMLVLQKLRYAVLALGDREYAQFCAFGHQLDDWLRRQELNRCSTWWKSTTPTTAPCATGSTISASWATVAARRTGPRHAMNPGDCAIASS
ncbi:flavodoxin domain-containing protein [Pseudoxanthomonas mexicana]|uniref:flavodoxin domain-containing protein n=1 Tax=Pseudoxanthomonas mexicana TaxID=128785 RepID=UPI003D2F8231